MDPKEMGTLPTEMGSPTESNLQNLCQPICTESV
jgi:hypothetical protein